MGECTTCHFLLPCNDTCFKNNRSSSVAKSDSPNECSRMSYVPSLISHLTVNISFPHPVRNVFVAGCCSGFNLKDKVSQIATPPLSSICLLLPRLSSLVTVLSLERLKFMFWYFLPFIERAQRSFKICSFKWLNVCLSVNLRLQC